MAQPGTRTFMGRMIGAAALNPNSYDAVSHDVRATPSALVIVLVTSIATGIGAIGASGFSGLIWSVIVNIAIWIAYVGIAYFIVTTVFRTGPISKRFGVILRPLAFAQVPAMLMIFGSLPSVSALLGILVSLWILAATVVAVRQAFDMKTLPAVGLTIVTWLLVLPLRYAFLLIH